jgi:hypothetical protein
MEDAELIDAVNSLTPTRAQSIIQAALEHLRIMREQSILRVEGDLAANLTIFQHTPLKLQHDPKQIRLLSLLPGSNYDFIRCRISHVSLSRPPAYEALSYCCGDPATPRVIVIEDHKQGRTKLQITQNLLVALKHLREESDEGCSG